MDNLIPGLFFSFIVGLGLGVLCASFDVEYHSAIIQHQCAQYNPKTGAFEWLKGENQ